MSIYHHDGMDDPDVRKEADEAYPWGDRAPFDWPEDDDFDIDQLLTDEIIEELLNEFFGPDTQLEKS